MSTSRPLPRPQPETEFYWQKARAGEFWYRNCCDCGKPYHYPRDICPFCHSRNVTWVRASGKGTVYSFAVVHRAPLDAFKADTPYVIALVDLDEGLRIASRIVDVDHNTEKLTIGVRVGVEYSKEGLPVFKLDEANQE